jgi:Transglutaminase-like superfamily
VPLGRVRIRHVSAAAALLGARVWLLVAPGQAVRWASRRRGVASVPVAARADLIARAIVGVSVRGPLTFTCLEQSLALVSLLAIRHTPARLVIGVSRAPLLAHAWVECDSRILLGESQSHGLTPLTDPAPSPCRG